MLWRRHVTEHRGIDATLAVHSRDDRRRRSLMIIHAGMNHVDDATLGW